MGKSRNSRSYTGIIVLLISMFVVGILVGMLIMYLIGLGKSDTKGQDTTINIEAADRVTHVHIPKRKIEYGTIPVNSYIKDNFVLEDDGYMAYYDEQGNKISHLGADISYHQKKINWDALKASPCEFLMIRCGYRGYTAGGLVEDEKFEEYATKATEYGIPFGVYFFTQALTEEEALAEADYTISLIEKYSISYPVAIDTEMVDDENARTNTTEMTPQERTHLVTVFCDRVKECGYYPMVYASENWLRRYLDASMLQSYEIWAPQYLDANDFMYDFSIWQYTPDGELPGIDGIVDLNISMVDYASFVPQMREAYLNKGKITEDVIDE